jgi:hypothetical protein
MNINDAEIVTAIVSNTKNIVVMIIYLNIVNNRMYQDFDFVTAPFVIIFFRNVVTNCSLVVIGTKLVQFAALSIDFA